MVTFNKFFNAILGRSHIDSSLISNNSPLLLHISDTPSQFYPKLNRIIKILEPKYIIHTGDLADNLKTELSPSLFVQYQREVKKLLALLNSSNTENIHLTMGNHDDYHFVDKHSGKLEIHDAIGELYINEAKFIFSHYSDYLKERDADVYLFGHSPKHETQVTESGIYLNGINSINIINLDTLAVDFLKYPYGTNPARTEHRRIKI